MNSLIAIAVVPGKRKHKKAEQGKKQYAPFEWRIFLINGIEGTGSSDKNHGCRAEQPTADSNEKHFPAPLHRSAEPIPVLAC
jgi:hypothetical protein